MEYVPVVGSLLRIFQVCLRLHAQDVRHVPTSLYVQSDVRRTVRQTNIHSQFAADVTTNVREFSDWLRPPNQWSVGVTVSQIGVLACIMRNGSGGLPTNELFPTMALQCPSTL